MKHILVIILAALMAAEAFSYATVADGNNNDRLETLWREYEDASQKDYIQRMTNILEKIKVEALKERSAWDYYKAVCFYVKAKSARNWKLTEELQTQAQEEITAYGEPVLDYLLRRESMSVAQKLDYLRENADKLKSRKNTDVYEGVRIVYADVLTNTISNDYQYVLWDVLTRSIHPSVEECADIYELLSESLAGVYPQAGLAEYIYMKRGRNSGKSAGVKEFEALAEVYKGKALGVMVNEFVLRLKLADAKDKGSSEYFRQMRQTVTKLIKERDSFYGGSERALAGYCDGLDDILKRLDAQVAYVTVKDADVQVAMRNLSRVKIKVSLEKETVFDTLLHNPVKSYYVPDTLTFPLPEMPDGDYKIECFSGVTQLGESQFSKNTLSMSLRQDSNGLSVYVADYESGEPLECVDLALYKEYPRQKVAEYKNLHLDGYTRLPEAIVKQMEPFGGTLECLARDSDGVERKISSYHYLRDYASQEEALSRHSHILLDKPAYNPGELLKFKAVIYERDSKEGSIKVLPSGLYTVKLTDANGEVVASKELRVNDFGSLAGEFALKSLTRYGNCSISVFEGNKMLGIEPFVVDEYVLPTFDVTFDKPAKVFYSGDQVVVRGRLESFAGHPLSSAKVSAVVTLSGKNVSASDVEVDADGTFEVTFNDVPDKKSIKREYSVEVKVTDGTGETHSYFFSQPVMVTTYLACKLNNVAAGSCTLHSSAQRVYLVDGVVASVACDAGYRYGFTCPGIPLKYKVLKDKALVMQGQTASGEVVELDFAGYDPGIYEFVLNMDAADREGEKKMQLMILPWAEGNISVPECVENVFRVVDDENISLQIGAGNGPVWAVVELFSSERELLKSEVVHIEKGGLRTISYAYEDTYPGAVEMKVLYFRNSESYEFSHVWTRPVPRAIVPLKFARFTDKSLPGSLCSVSLQTASDVEAVASVYDISTEQIYDSPWRRIDRTPVTVNPVKVHPVEGNYGRDYPMTMGDDHSIFFMDMYLFDDPFSGQVAGVTLENSVVVGYGGGGIFGSRARTKYTGLAVDDAPSMDLSFAELEPASAAAVSVPEVKIRSTFAPALAFEPFLYPSEDGEISFDFQTSDKLSTFVVSVFAHDKQMNNNVLRGEMLVTMPVKLAVAQPQYLYAGDRYVMEAAVSNVSSSDVSGDVTVEVYATDSYEGAEPILTDVRKVNVPCGGTSAVPFEVNVPSDVDVLGFKVVFTSGDVSDGVFVTVPVYERAQVIREAHSAVVLSGMSEDAVLKELRERFVNGSSTGAEYSSLTLMDMLYDALPLVAESNGEDAVSQSETMYVNMLAAGLRAADGGDVREYVEAAHSAIGRLMACADEDGGFGWFKGMRPSPIITVLVLERYAGLRDRGLLTLVSDILGEDALDDFDEAVCTAVRYLDLVCFSEPDRPSWYGSISLWQYLRVRSMYAGVPFDKQAARKAVGLKEYIDFHKDVKSCLVPKKRWRWTDGEILSKARMISILNNLISSREGLDLAAAWGLSSKAKMSKSMAVELESLKEYAVEHPSGGVYYPNAVLPWRGLLESEAYAHSLICDLFKDLSADTELADRLSELADGIRLWLMLQKETQKWDSDPGFVEAMASVYDASSAVKDTSVVILSKRFLKPFESVVESGNGFKVSVKYYKETADSGRVELAAGDKLLVGDKIVAVYSLWSEENRSFVRLSVPRPACLRPQDQLSGSCGLRLRPLSYRGLYSISPYAYREVRADKTFYWIDVFPEEDSTVEEVLFVTQEGEFVSPVAEIESLYAPHYRANDGFAGGFSVE